MIELITGLPGNSKTLYAISYIKAWSEKDNRAVYYSGIPELKLPWVEIDPTKWMECPSGSIVVIDEAQRIYRNRSMNSAQLPDYVTELETHRHKGIDLVFITQHPMLVDPQIRRLAGRHKHLVRIWGMEASTIHKWDAVRDNCDKPAHRKDSEKTKWIFDKSVYSLYKSAELHTVKRSLPKRLLIVLAAPLLIAGAFFVVKHKLFKEPANTSPQVQHASSGKVAGGSSEKPFDPILDAKKYVFAQTPRVKDLEYTAPKYDELTKPSTVPMPAACISSARGCSCFTQQGTPLKVPETLCKDIVEHGYFEEFDPNGKQHKEVNPLKQLERPQVAQNQPQQTPVNITITGSDGFGVLGKHHDGVREPPIDSDSQADPDGGTSAGRHVVKRS